MKHISSLSVDYLGFTDCRSSQRASEDFDLYNGQCCLRQHLDKLPSSSSSSNNSVVDVVVAVFVVVVIVDVVVVAVVSSKKDIDNNHKNNKTQTVTSQYCYMNQGRAGGMRGAIE